MLQKVKLKDRLPEKEGRYFVEYKHNNFESSVYFNGKRFEISEFEEIVYWYEKAGTDIDYEDIAGTAVMLILNCTDIATSKTDIEMMRDIIATTLKGIST